MLAYLASYNVINIKVIGKKLYVGTLILKDLLPGILQGEPLYLLNYLLPGRELRKNFEG